MKSLHFSCGVFSCTAGEPAVLCLLRCRSTGSSGNAQLHHAIHATHTAHAAAHTTSRWFVVVRFTNHTVCSEH